MPIIDDIRVDIGDDGGTVPSGVSTHELLSTSHGDTLVGVPTNGGLIVGNGTDWLALPSGEEGLTLRILGGTIVWGSGLAGPASTQTLAQTLGIGNTATLPIIWNSGLGATTHLQGPSDEVFKLASGSGQSLELYAGDVLRAIISPTGTQLLNTVDINSIRDSDGDGILKAGAIQFYTLGSGLSPAHSEGLVYWNVDDKTLNLMTELTNTSIQVGQEMVLRATNKTGSSILNGQLVYVDGAQGNRPTIQLAIADLSISSDTVIGMVTSDIANNDTGYATIFGQVRDVNTSAFSVGSQLWLSPTTSGAFTDIQPIAPNHSVSIGNVNRSHSTEGIIQLRIINGTDLSSLHDVAISGITDGQVIVYDATQGIFVPSGIVTSVGAHDLLSSVHTDTATSSASNASLIYGSGSIWNVLPSGSEGEIIGILGGQLTWTTGIQGPTGATGPSGVAGPSGVDGVVGVNGSGLAGFTLVVPAIAFSPAPGVDIATFSTRNNHGILNFDDTTSESGVIEAAMHTDYISGTTFDLDIYWTGDAGSGNIKWDARFETNPSGANIDSNSFALNQTVTSTAIGSGDIVKSRITYTAIQADNIDSLMPFRCVLVRDTSVAGNMIGDAQVTRAIISQQAQDILDSFTTGPSGITGPIGPAGSGITGFTVIIPAAAMSSPPGTNIATFSTRNNHGILNFDDTTSESGMVEAAMHVDYVSGVLFDVDIYWTADAPSGNVGWDGRFEAFGSGISIDTNSFGANKNITSATLGSGIITKSRISYTSAQADNINSLDPFRLILTRDISVDSNVVGDAQILNVAISQSAQDVLDQFSRTSFLGGQNTTASYIVIESEDYLTFVNASGATVVLNSTPETWETHIIKDGIGNASTNPINIFGSGSLIDGLSSVSIASDWAAISVVYNGTRWGII